MFKTPENNYNEIIMMRGIKVLIGQCSITGGRISAANMSNPKPLYSTPKQSIWTWVLVFIAGASLCCTVVYAVSLSSSTGTLGRLITSVASPSTAVRILRILSEATSLLFVALINLTLDQFIWTAASNDRGITMSTLLSVSSSTSVFGLLELLTWNAVGLHHISVLLR